ncbi:hypothetical protein TIFTF001_016671 [Ficus carica]|uniref:RING-type domain-containing protein n=1 Tax=Ficus carica TaxID=3494 RepID=A0AA88A7Y8_FICCA|nr:hypothetical protein TIFTF001_016671 [Ficus carica]
MAGMLPGVECARRRRFHQSGGSSDCLTAPAYGGTRRPSFCLYTSNNEKTHHITSTSLMRESGGVGCRRLLWDERAECSDGPRMVGGEKVKVDGGLGDSERDGVVIGEQDVGLRRRRRANEVGDGLSGRRRGERSRTWRSPNDSLSFSGDSPSWDDQKLGVEAREAKERLDGRLRTQRKSESIRKNGKSVVKGDEVQVEVYGTRKSGSRRFSWAKLSWKASDQEECAICLEWFRAGETLVHLPCAHRFHHGCLVPWLENNSHCPCCRTVVSVMTQI